MKKLFQIIIVLIILLPVTVSLTPVGTSKMESANLKETRIKLPEPVYDSPFSVEKAILKRRSIRRYKDKPLIIKEVSQLLWAASGITDKRGLRTAPSAGALYPLEVYVVACNVDKLPPGIYKYRPHEHELQLIKEGDKRKEICNAALSQSCVENGAIVIIFSAVYERTTRKYGERGIRYVHMEVGHAGQNVSLQAISLGLGTVVVGAFYDDEIKRIMNMPEEESPLYIMPVGRM